MSDDDLASEDELASEENPESGSESQEPEAHLASLIDLDARVTSGANWFYWIAALSLVNSVIVMAEGEWSFIVGLGVTQIVDWVSIVIAEEAPEWKTIVTVVAILANLVTVTICGSFGFFANRKHVWAFWVGMVLYALDGLLILLVGDILSFGFHVFALWCIFSGLRALQEIRAAAANLDIEAVAPE